LRTDDFGYELYWEVIDDTGEVYASGGNAVVGDTGGGAQIATPFDPGAYPSNEIILESFTLPADGCYTLRLLDDFADGLCCFYGNGFYRLREMDMDVLLSGGEFGAIAERPFSVGEAIVSTQDHAPASTVPLLFPNPVRAGTPLQLSWEQPPASTVHWRLADAQGRLIARGWDTATIPTQQLTPGYYLLQVLTDTDAWSLPFLVAE
ncbi:MAG: T9SS type A sorting domain-containing protein, partial [Lewinella sp.]|nr:T9SS type A sorting domain-containing protein [Lewinella sp.]